MPTFELIEAKAHHCGQMGRILRKAHADAIVRAGKNPHRELRNCFDASYYRRAWLVDGRLAALAGVIGTSASSHGLIWLAISDEAARHPRALVRCIREQFKEIMLVKRELATTVLGDDDDGKRLVVFLGFHVSEEGDGQRAHTRNDRRALLGFLDRNGPHHVQIGGASAIAMGYHEEYA